VVVSIGESDGGIQMAVADDGAPPPAPATTAGSGHGLRMLVERAARLGGRISLVHDEDGGSTLRVMLPLAGAEW
jgi:signal transduction histidine kinase